MLPNGTISKISMGMRPGTLAKVIDKRRKFHTTSFSTYATGPVNRRLGPYVSTDRIKSLLSVPAGGCTVHLWGGQPIENVFSLLCSGLSTVYSGGSDKYKRRLHCRSLNVAQSRRLTVQDMNEYYDQNAASQSLLSLAHRQQG